VGGNWPASGLGDAEGYRNGGTRTRDQRMETTIRIRGMSGGHCVKAVEGTLRRVPDVTVVRVSIGEAVIETPAGPDLGRIRKELADEGYEVD